MVYIENEGALFRGPARGVPQEVWSAKEGKFAPYKGSKDKPIDWGNVVSPAEAEELIGAKLPAEEAAESPEVEKTE